MNDLFKFNGKDFAFVFGSILNNEEGEYGQRGVFSDFNVFIFF